MSKRFEYIISEIQDQYLLGDDDDKPWIVGFSGGKDSTVLLQLVWEAIRRLPEGVVRKREVHVICNDTMVENPIITEYVSGVLKKIQKAAVVQGMPIQVKETTPRLEDSFWLNMLGRGYPVPNNMFRWCTDRLKIRPTSRLLQDQINENGEAIILLGTRSAESQTRARSMKKHEVKGSRLTNHGNERNTKVYAPIKDLMTEEVWGYINSTPSPWGADNAELFKIYSDASADDYECPTVVTTKDHKTCGQSRFGCWVCTVVKQDKSMTALIENGLGWMRPMLELRNRFVEERNIPSNRMVKRRNGSSDSVGPYTPAYRANALKELLQAQREIQKVKPHLDLITKQELVAIQAVWNRDAIFEHSVSAIYNDVYEIEMTMGKSNEKIEEENQLLKKACKGNPKNFELINQLLILQKNKSLLNRKRGLKDDIESRIEKAISK